MSGFVLDVSVTMAWHFEDEATPETWALLERLQTETAWVPSLWPLEVANVLLLAERRRHAPPARTVAFIEQLHSLSILIDEETAPRALHEVLPLARAQGLTAYDACYLELAMRRRLPVATMDKAMREAALRTGVAMLP